MKPPEVFVHRDATLLARAAAARLVTRLVDAQSGGAVPHLVLTGGRSGGELLAEIAASPARDAVDWARVEVWWGDERYLPAGDPERNETQARAALLDRVGVDPGRVHPMPASDGGLCLRRGRRGRLRRACFAEPPRRRTGWACPPSTSSCSALGEDGHVASVFPESPALHDERTVVAVRGAPKPPPTRITLTLRRPRAGPGGVAAGVRRGQGPRRRAGALGGWGLSDPGRRSARALPHAGAARPGGRREAAEGIGPTSELVARRPGGACVRPRAAC